MGIARAAVAAGVDMGVKMTTEEFNKVLKNIVPNAPVIPSPREKSVADISAELREILGREES
jgi:NAD(P)H-hydrate repair Nnr-like enzyme with NAD(P)H-hydrate dehydratase domain